MPAYPADSSAEITAALGAMPSGSAVSGVAKRLLDLFTSGQVVPGTRLPPERELASTLEVGRSAVREALAALEILGIVDVRPGSGTYLRGTSSEMLPQTLSWGLLIGERSTAELLEMRSGLEIHVARLGATRLTDRQLATLGRHLRRMRASVDDLRAFVRADLEFHHSLASGIDNKVLLDTLQVIRSLLRVWADRAVHDTTHAVRAIEEHDAIYQALVRRDPDAAAAAMAAHMQTASIRLAGADTE